MPLAESAPPRCKLALADGTVVEGRAIGHRGETGGELCFNTSMSGYQEIMTDPSYHGQLMMMTYPHIGNYGASDGDMEAARPQIAGLVVRAFADRYSNRLAGGSLGDWMRAHELVGISGIDTRAFVRRIREAGVMNAVISATDLDDESLVEKARAWPSMEGLELASRVTTEAAYDFATGGAARIAVLDYGVKRNILRMFAQRGCAVRVFPQAATLAEVIEWKPDGLFFSNGPGDPRAMPHAIAFARQALAGDLPLFGICLGHQLLALASGFDVYKMRVGHRGANHPVQNLETGRVEVTTQNHGFAVREESLTDAATVTHRNLNDGTVEGIRLVHREAFGIQYHPEASPGPHDSQYLFDAFLRAVKQHAAPSAVPA